MNGAFQGASYFRLLGKGQRYGQSARGLAIDCGEPDRPEEFPLFTDWWLGKPDRQDDRVKIFAVLDSVSCVGTYKMVIIPGESTVLDIDAVLYFREPDKIHAVNPDRKELKSIGLAPLTSMFWIGKASERKFDDLRPEVHDSDGLLIQMDNGETLWRPLNNPKELRHQRFAAKDIRGFGLLQRERDFAAYQDLFNFYHLTPSVWVEPHATGAPAKSISSNFPRTTKVSTTWLPTGIQRPSPSRCRRIASATRSIGRVKPTGSCR